MLHKIIILDFGSQYTQLIARNIRELNVYCEIIPYHTSFNLTPDVKGIILSGSPCSVNEANAPHVNISEINKSLPILGICYGAQLITKQYGGEVQKSNHREYGRAQVKWSSNTENPLLAQIPTHTPVWMSHADTITTLAPQAIALATTQNIPVAAFEIRNTPNPLYGLQFHPEVTHTTEGKNILRNFVLEICSCKPTFTPAHYITETTNQIKQQVGNKQVLMALSGGVDSTVAAMLIHQAIGKQLYCIFVDNGLLRKNEFETVLQNYTHLGLNIKGVNAQQSFYTALKGVTDPEEKRKIIGRLFIEVFEQEANQLTDIHYLGQGTIYPDVIESVSVKGPSATIKSHHNVGGLPARMNLQLIEPLRLLFKDEVRKIGLELGISPSLIQRHPFPGPGLGIRIIGDVTPQKIEMLQQADAIFIQALQNENLYTKVWQAGVMLLPVQSVGVMGDERTYEYAVALRAVTSTDGMTADWADLPHAFLASVSNQIINQVKGINRVVYDISSKPPATIEWE